MNVMIDLETLSTRKNAVILVLCAVKFNPHNFKGVDNLETFYYRINIESCKRLGMSSDAETLKWWNSQAPAIRDEAFAEPRYELVEILKKFSVWLNGCERIWSHGASFDIPILEEAYSLAHLPIPWKYYNIRDTRTLYDLAQVTLSNSYKHNALYDCYNQIEAVVKSLQNLVLK